MINHDEASENELGAGVKLHFGEALEMAITTPSRYERPHCPDVWLIWTIDEDSEYSGFPNLHCICTTEDSCRYHIGALLEQNKNVGTLKGRRPQSEQWFLNGNRQRFHVERAPSNHSFGSSVVGNAHKFQFEIMSKPISIGQARKFDFGGE